MREENNTEMHLSTGLIDWVEEQDEGEGGEDEPPRRRIGDFFKGLAERFQDLF